MSDMRLLLDTHLYIWWLNKDRHLSKITVSLIAEAQEVYISSASIWESAIKIQLGKLKANLDQLVMEIQANNFLELPITAKHAAVTSQLSNLHSDPFDRILIAQAISGPLLLLTTDKKLATYSDLVKIV